MLADLYRRAGGRVAGSVQASGRET